LARRWALFGDLEVDSLSCCYGESKVVAHTCGDADRQMSNWNGACQIHVVANGSDAPGVS